MAGRYTGWRRLLGDTETRPDLFDFGKKLLGYVAEQRELSGVKTQSRTVKLPDGSIVRAGFVYELPYIEVLPAEEEGSSLQTTVAGFVVSPSPNDVRTASGSALDIADWADLGTNPEVFVAVTNTAYHPAGFSKYKRLFPFGIRQVGNIDWRDKGETWILSYYGPRSRYFENDFGAIDHGGISNESGFKPWVIRNGYTLLNLATDSYAAVAPDTTTGVIVGAGVRGGSLVYVARNGTTEYAYRVPLSSSDPKVARIGVNLAGLQLLATRTMLSGEELGEAAHPWLFNQSGTEARCIRQSEGGDVVNEGVLSLADLDNVTFTMTAVGVGLTTTTSTNYPAGTGSATHQTGWIDSTGSATFHSFGSAAWGSNGTIGASHATTVVGSGEVKCAVDFRDDVPVYAYAMPEHSSTSYGETNVLAFDETATTYSSARDTTTSSTMTGKSVGVRTDFLTVQFDVSETITSSQSGSLDLILAGNAPNTNLGNNNYTSGTFVRHEDTTTERDYSGMSVSYMDLRYGWLVYERPRSQETITGFCDNTTALTGLNDDSVGKNYEVDTTSDTTNTVSTVVTKDGVVLYEDTLVQETTATSTLAKPIFYDDGFINSFYTEVDTDNPDFIVRVCNFDTFTAEGAWAPGVAASDTNTSVRGVLTNWFVDTLNSGALNFGTRSWRMDQNGVVGIGSWQQYKTQWCFSMGLPRSAWETTSFVVRQDRWASGIKGGDLATLVTDKSERWVSGAFVENISAPHDLFFPISVVAPVATVKKGL